ncbi:MAG: 50S ribosomal protein L20 [Candidatus Buchananbacteria bacterium RBG_13_36_9]|uniref:Large ribosomal subunit protein bL20 n=1 Tax=Candidatus Buchananbacteria bacterium RBG_13_36_9 TaxID=1797530 RepID=A0A1G1XSG3_9BACT|nr:MAG: 50S ribosomal protein L20 [Candidatus Buchananbacteria bacterium RBG_13_36_9]
MPRVKRAVVHLKKRRTIRKATKGYMWGRKKTIRLGRTAMLKAGVYAFRDRRKKKSEMRKLWNIRINAACREQGLSYSKFINLLAKKKIGLDRKVLSDIAMNYPKVFEKIIQTVK